jgi:3-dehydroquinate dehydratase-1
MRLQCANPLRIRNRILGGPAPLICLPLVAVDPEALMDQAAEVCSFDPDCIEWRVDRFEAVRDTEAVLASLAALRGAIGEIPLIFTCRSGREGGFQDIPLEDRVGINRRAAAAGLVDLVDTELSSGEAAVGEAKDACRRGGAKLILSYHNFEETPEERFLLDRLAEAQELGGDVAKVAVMPKSYRDVLTLLSATYTARTELLRIPIITMSMGAEGAVTRIAGGLFGSDLTFAIGKAGSAPGQIPIEALRNAWSALPFD